ncbi:unnamed protein product [Notodromas monacha]|uniref:Uncharacterized protein n=1 Tax=Notodromas monacha TaxID=399045 RepID=A0A7R9BKE0_9CRUS|nr:unnamed protein product [Notodromas monacha]CAG0915746.1 unnamed protein product [Notodromas monacha]
MCQAFGNGMHLSRSNARKRSKSATSPTRWTYSRTRATAFKNGLSIRYGTSQCYITCTRSGPIVNKLFGNELSNLVLNGRAFLWRVLRQRDIALHQCVKVRNMDDTITKCPGFLGANLPPPCHGMF